MKISSVEQTFKKLSQTLLPGEEVRVLILPRHTFVKSTTEAEALVDIVVTNDREDPVDHIEARKKTLEKLGKDYKTFPIPALTSAGFAGLAAKGDEIFVVDYDGTMEPISDSIALNERGTGMRWLLENTRLKGTEMEVAKKMWSFCRKQLETKRVNALSNGACGSFGTYRVYPGDAELQKACAQPIAVMLGLDYQEGLAGVLLSSNPNYFKSEIAGSEEQYLKYFNEILPAIQGVPAVEMTRVGIVNAINDFIECRTYEPHIPVARAIRLAVEFHKNDNTTHSSQTSYLPAAAKRLALRGRISREARIWNVNRVRWDEDAYGRKNRQINEPGPTPYSVDGYSRRSRDLQGLNAVYGQTYTRYPLDTKVGYVLKVIGLVRREPTRRELAGCARIYRLALERKLIGYQNSIQISNLYPEDFVKSLPTHIWIPLVRSKWHTKVKHSTDAELRKAMAEALKRNPKADWTSVWGNLPVDGDFTSSCKTREIALWAMAKRHALEKKHPVYMNDRKVGEFSWSSRLDEVEAEDLVWGGKVKLNADPVKVFERVKNRLEERALSGPSKPVARPRSYQCEIAGSPVELLSTTRAIFLEGHAMKHCVSGYAEQARSGHCFLFHWGETAPGGVTIQLDGHGQLVQAAGYYNTHVDSEMRAAIYEWVRTVQI